MMLIISFKNICNTIESKHIMHNLNTWINNCGNIQNNKTIYTVTNTNSTTSKNITIIHK